MNKSPCPCSRITEFPPSCTICKSELFPKKKLWPSNTIRLSLKLLVPPAESNTNPPDVVVTVLPLIWTLSTRSSVTGLLVPMDTPSIWPPLISAPDDWKASKYAVPSIYKSCHLSDEVPKSWVSSADGTNALLNLPVAVIAVSYTHLTLPTKRIV